MAQEIGELTVRLSVTRTALHTAKDAPDGSGASPHGTTKPSTPDSQVHMSSGMQICIHLDHCRCHTASSMKFVHNSLPAFGVCLISCGMRESMLGWHKEVGDVYGCSYCSLLELTLGLNRTVAQPWY